MASPANSTRVPPGRKAVNMGDVVTCSRCKAGLPRSAFYKSSYKKNGLQSACKSCSDAWRVEKKAESEEFRDRQRAYSRKWAATNRQQMLDLYRCYNMRRKYGLSAEDVTAFHSAHDDTCAICGEKKPLSIDHNHATGQVRGSLCADCNFGIGNFKDSIPLLARAVLYLSVQPEHSEAVNINVRRDRKASSKGRG